MDTFIKLLENPFSWFLFFVAILMALGFRFWRSTIKELSRQAGEHAKLHAYAYARCLGYVTVATFDGFIEVFQTLRAEDAAALPWWSWAVMFFKPVRLGVVAFLAFLDQSISRAQAPVQQSQK